MAQVLSRYGKVEGGIRWNKYSYGDAKGLYNGTRTAKMILTTHIPSSVTVLDQSIVFMYQGQTRTCFKCGHSGHYATDCKNEEPRINIFSEENFPALNINESTLNNSNLEGATGNNDKLIMTEADKVDSETKAANVDENVNEDNETVTTKETILLDKGGIENIVNSEKASEIENNGVIENVQEYRPVESKIISGNKTPSKTVSENKTTHGSDTSVLSKENDKETYSLAYRNSPKESSAQASCFASCSETQVEETDIENKNKVIKSCNSKDKNEIQKNTNKNKGKDNILDGKIDKNADKDKDNKRKSDINKEKNEKDIACYLKSPLLTQRSTRDKSIKQKDGKNDSSKDRKSKRNLSVANTHIT